MSNDNDLNWPMFRILDKLVNKPKKKSNPYCGKAKRRAKKLGIEITIEDFGRDNGRGYWIEYKGWDDGLFCNSWDEVYDKLCQIEKELNA